MGGVVLLGLGPIIGGAHLRKVFSARALITTYPQPRLATPGRHNRSRREGVEVKIGHAKGNDVNKN